MTICAILFGLLPIMWSPTTQSGADVMKRITAPMIGGVVTSGVLELLLYPVIFVLWRRGQRDWLITLRACLSAPWKGAELQWESKPTRQLSLQPVAAEAGLEAMKGSKPLV